MPSDLKNFVEQEQLSPFETSLIAHVLAVGQRVIRSSFYAIAAAVLGSAQPYYDISSFLMFITVFGLACTNRMRWVSEVIIVLFLVLTFLPKDVALKIGLGV